MTGRRRPGREDRGSFTAELAVGLPALMLLLLAGLCAVTAVTTRLQCVDAARAGALAASRGESGAAEAARVAPDGAEVQVSEGGDTVVVRVSAEVPVLGSSLTVDASATAAREPTQ